MSKKFKAQSEGVLVPMAWATCTYVIYINAERYPDFGATYAAIQPES